MPTGPGSDLIPVRKDTKRRLARLKGSATYDELLRALLDAVPAGALDARVRAGPPVPEPRERPPEKQLMIADLAARRWERWLAQGRVTPLGPRLFAWREAPARRREVKLDVVGRRGLPP